MLYTEYWTVDSGQRLKTTEAPLLLCSTLKYLEGFEVEMSEERSKSKDK